MVRNDDVYCMVGFRTVVKDNRIIGIMMVGKDDVYSMTGMSQDTSEGWDVKHYRMIGVRT